MLAVALILEPILPRGPVVFQVRVDRVGQESEPALAQLQLEHGREVEVVEDVAEAGVDVGLGLADADIPLHG